MSKYVNLATLKNYIGYPLDEGDDSGDSLLQMALDNAEQGINSYTRRNFVGEAGTRSFNRFDQDFIRSNTFWLQEDLHTLTGLILGDSQVVPVGPGGSVWLQPRQGPPYRGVQLKSSYVFTWNTDQDMHISGTWGYGTVAPADIQQATLRYAAFLYRQKDITPNDQIGYDQGAGVTPMGRGMPDDVRYLLSPYRSRTGGVV